MDDDFAPLFEHWRAEFARLGAYPYLWTLWEHDPVRLGERWRDQVARAAEDRARQRTLIGYGIWTYKLRFARPICNEPEPVQELELTLAPRVAAGDESAAPPFYPGWRGSFSLFLPRQIERHGFTDCFDPPPWW